MIGTDETEYIDDPDALVRYTKLEFEQPEPWPIGPAEIDAWADGDLG
jgi:hypothetical protein